MTAAKQDFQSYAGDAANPIFTVRDGSNNPIDLSSVEEIEWFAQRDLQSSPVIDKLKSLNKIVFVTDGTDGKFKVLIATGETSGFAGFYVHRAKVTDSSGNVSTVTIGRWQVAPAPIATFSGDPAVNPRDAVRSHMGDTDMSNPQLTDPQIDYLLNLYPNPFYAAAAGCRQLASLYARKVNKRVGDLSINYTDIAKNYRDMARELEAQGATFGLAPYSGGISRSDKEAVNQNTDRVKPPFREKQFDNRSGLNNTSDLDGNFDDQLSDGS